MLYRRSLGAIALALTLALALPLLVLGGAQAFDDAQYPNLKGQWVRARGPAGVVGQGPFDPSKSWGRAQQAPLTPEYQAMLEASLADQAAGGPGYWPGVRCLPPGMPAMMTNFRPMEIIVKPESTWLLIDHIHETHRRIYTDGRDWPALGEPTFDGYSIGRWIDEDGDGRYDLLEIETRHFKGPRAFEPSGMLLHADGKTVIKERLFLDKADPNLLHDHMTVIDSALTRPWDVHKQYRRVRDAPALAGGHLRRRAGDDPCRQGNLLDRRRRPPHAGQEGPAAAGPALLQG